MAKDNREILEAVRISGHGVFVKGQEDQLEAVMSAKEAKSLTDKGVIAGFAVEETEEEFTLPSAAQLKKMSKAKLVVVADKAGVEVTPDSMSNDEIIAAILGGE